MDKLTKEQRRKNMQAVKNKGSQIELLFGRALWAAGLRYRKNYSKVFGKPDFVLSKHKIVIFCDSEFWHGKNWNNAKKEIKSNQDFWYKKISSNIERDKKVNKTLKADGWKVFRFWGRDIIKNPDGCAAVVNEYIKNERKN